MTTKKLSELEVLEALGEGTYAVVEENGEAKRYPAGGFGAVKSVNGVTPDAAGNVAVEIPEGPNLTGYATEAYVDEKIGEIDIPESTGPVNWEDIKGRPFGEEYISGTILPKDTYAHADTFACPDLGRGDGYYFLFDGKDYAPNWDYYEIDGESTLCFGSPDFEECPFFVARVPLSAGDIWYVYYADGGEHTLEIYSEYHQVNCLDEMYIPDTIARKSDLPEVPTHTWETLPDKPFWESDKIVLLEERSFDGEDTGLYIPLERELFGYPPIEKCTVVLDGEKYEGTVRIRWDDVTYEDIVEVDFSDWRLSSVFGEHFLPAGLHTVEAYAGGEVAPLDEKFMPVLTSPNGTKYKISVADDGTLSTVSV